MKLSQPWFNLVRSGRKSVEGRVNDEKRQSMKVGDVIIFKNSENSKKSFKVKIIERTEHENFENALRQGRLKNMLPGIRTYKEGVQIYENIPGYKNGANKYGVVNLVIKLI